MAEDEPLREPLTLACTSVTITPRDDRLGHVAPRMTARIQTTDGEVVAIFMGGDDVIGDEVYIER